MIRYLIKFFIDKPVLNHILFIFLVLVGSMSYLNIPKEIFPPVNLDAIEIRGHYIGASPDILDKMVVSPIEDDIKNLSKIDSLKSNIKTGAFYIKAELKDGTNSDDTLSEIKDIISNIRPNLPHDMDEPIAKKIVNSFPLVTIAIASKKSKEEMLEVAKKLKKSLSNINNLSKISIRGDVDKELLFQLNSKKIDALNLNKQAVIKAISSLSSIFPLGMIKQKGNHLFLSTYNGIKDLDELKNTIILVQDKKIRIKDIAKINFQLDTPKEISHFNSLSNISVNITKDKKGNAILLVKRIKSILKNYQNIYKDYRFEIYTDTSIWIRNRLNTVISNIIFGLILVGLSIWLFINWRISFIVSIGIPTSFLIGLIATYILDYSLNMLSLLGGLIALGMLVDEAIVVAENIQRHIEDGKTPKNAAIDGATQMFPAVLTATMTTVFAFLPLLIMSGEMGKFMKIIPIMITILLLSSLYEAFFFLPLHAVEFLRKERRNIKKEKFWYFLKKNYQKVLQLLLKYKKRVLISFLLFNIISIVYMLKISKFQLFPEFDTTQIYISGKVDKNFDIYQTQTLITQVEKSLLGKLDKDDVSSITSVSGMKLDKKSIPHIAENNFHIFINLHEMAPQNFYNRFINPHLSPEYDNSDMIRKHTAREIAKKIKELTKQFKKDKNFKEFNVIVPGAGIVESDIAISLIGKDKDVKLALNKLTNNAIKIDGVYNITNDMKNGEEELKFKINSYGASLGFNEQIISNFLKPLFLKEEIAKMFYQNKLIKIKSQDIEKDKVSTINNLYIEIPNSDKKVLLKDIVTFIKKPSYETIYKEGGKKIWTFFGSLDKKIITSSEFLSKIDPILKEIKKSGIDIKIKGEEKENKKIQKEMSQAALIAIFLIFITLIWMFNSIKLSIFVLSVIPFSILGVLIGHFIMGLNLTMPSMLGVVGLAGVVVNDGIIMIDFIQHSKNDNEIIKKALMRLRPILLTSITTILGLSTLILFASGQSKILQPMAISLGFGLAWATILNLFFIPLLFATFQRGIKF